MRRVGASDEALLQALSYGVLRDYRALEALARGMLSKPLTEAPLVHAVLLVGLYQLRSMGIAAHAVLSETVDAVAVLGAPGMRGLVNAILRRYQREQPQLERRIPRDLDTRLSYPVWLVESVRQDWPENWISVLEGGNQAGPMTLRVNARHGGSVTDYQQRLQAAESVASETVPGATAALVLASALPVERLPGFADGDVSVQDASAQLAAEWLDAGPGMRVLDACAAPGGKTAHLLERHPDLELTALDIDGGRLERVRENLDRLGLQADLVTADASSDASWWDGKPFDRILLDAPCSGTGVIRRHPDIKWLRRSGDVPRLAEQQYQLLKKLWPMLAPGGVLLYATCSILSAEGEQVIRRFLLETADAKPLPIDLPGFAQKCRPGLKIAPGGAYDGFYYMRLAKPATSHRQ